MNVVHSRGKVDQNGLVGQNGQPPQKVNEHRFITFLKHRFSP